MADNVIRFPNRARPKADHHDDSDDATAVTAGSLPPLTTAYPGMPRQSPRYDHVPWTDLITRDFDGRG